MHEGQKQFFDYMMECVQEDKKDIAEDMLNENFRQQSEGTFSKEAMEAFQIKVMKLLKPERSEEVMNTMKQFGGDHISK